MSGLLILLVFSALFIQGWDYCLQYDAGWEPSTNPDLKNPFGDFANNKEVFWFIKFYLGTILWYLNMMWLAKPLLLCRVCMASAYGSIIFFSYNYFVSVPNAYLVWPVFCIALAGLNRILLRLF